MRFSNLFNMFEFLFFLLLLFLGYFFWKRVEKNHYRSIETREKELQHIVVLWSKTTRNIELAHSESSLISENVVISIDAFKKFFAGLINLFGGRVHAYESLVDRARREAVLRVKEEAQKNGYNTLVNLRIETTSITKNARQNVWAVEAIAYATWLTREIWK